jgi:hypothetical protein
MRPNLEEYAVYLADRIREQEQIIFKLGEAINNLDARLMMAERLLAKFKKMADGEQYDETKHGWWN